MKPILLETVAYYSGMAILIMVPILMALVILAFIKILSE